jgi:thiamine phosphate synthase YjbQ (UPF0047 family)
MYIITCVIQLYSFFFFFFFFQGAVFSAEFRQEMQKEIERNLNLRNEIRHRIITADTTHHTDKKKTQEGLKYLVSERRESAGLASLSTSTSSSTNSSILSTVLKKEIPQQQHNHHHTTSHNNNNHLQSHYHEEEPKQPVLRPASFLTGFGGFGGSSAEGLANANFITRGIPPRTFTTAPSTISSSSRSHNEPSISTRFFQRIASRLDDYDNKNMTH